MPSYPLPAPHSTTGEGGGGEESVKKQKGEEKKVAILSALTLLSCKSREKKKCGEKGCSIQEQQQIASPRIQMARREGGERGGEGRVISRLWRKHCSFF